MDKLLAIYAEAETMKKRNDTGLLMGDKSVFFVSFTLLLFSIVSCKKEMQGSAGPGPAPMNDKIMFQKIYEPPSSAIACQFSQVQPTKDGGYILAGLVYDSLSNWHDAYLVKANSRGETIWTRLVGGQFEDAAWSVLETSDDGYIAVGLYSPDYVNSGKSALLIKLNTNGNILWTETIGLAGTGLLSPIEGYNIAEAKDKSGYVMCGSYEFGGAIFLAKVSINGSLLWTKIFDHTEFGSSIQQTTDGGFIITGSACGWACGAALIKTDGDGNILWAKAYVGREGGSTGYSVQQTKDGGYIIAGQIYGVGGLAAYDAFLLKTDANGDAVWEKTYGVPDHDSGNSVLQTEDGGYIMCGYTGWFDTTHADVSLIKTDENGNIIWSKAFGGTNFDRGQCVAQTNDGGYVVVGYSESFGDRHNFDGYLIKTDSTGNSGCNENDARINSATLIMDRIIPTITISSVGNLLHPSLKSQSGGSYSSICMTVK